MIRTGLTDVGESYDRIGCPPRWDQEPIWTADYQVPADPLPAEHREILRHFECIGTADVGVIVDRSQNAKRRASAVRYHRARGELLGLLVGNTFRFPTFQFDVTGGCIAPLVAQANVALGAKEDPWRAAAWWSTPTTDTDNCAPMNLLLEGKLTRQIIDTALIARDVR